MKRFSWKHAFVFFLPLQFLLFHLVEQNQSWVEKFYIPTIFQNLTSFLRSALGSTEFSVGIILFYILVVFLTFKIGKTIVSLIRKQVPLRSVGTNLLNVVVLFAVLYPIFMIIWGLAYHRKPIAQIVSLNTKNVSSQDLEKLCERLIYLTNSSRKLVPDIRKRSYKFQDLFQQATVGYGKVSATIPELSYQIPSIKMGFTKNVMSYFSIAGIYFPFTAEANINGNLTSFEAPVVICHEMAHQLGFAAEDEANYIAYLVCANNPRPEFKYSANHWIMFSAMNSLRNVNEIAYKKLMLTIDKEVILDDEFSNSISRKFRNPIQDFTSEVIYDLFLKANDQESGINSYGLVTELMIGEMRKNNLTFLLASQALPKPLEICKR